MAARNVKALAFSCAHSPFTPRRHLDFLLGRITQFQPDIIINLGDWFESCGGSVHENEYDHDQRDEYEFAADMSRRIREAAGDDCKLVWLLGNHDDNLQAPDKRRVPPQLRSLVHWNNSEWKDEFLRWHQVRHENSARGTYHVGQLVFYHGYDFGKISDEREAMRMNRNTGFFSHRCFVRGHTHRPVPVTQMGAARFNELPWWYANVGTIGPLKPTYTQRMDTSYWWPATFEAECKEGRLSRIHGKNWSAEVRMMPT